MHVGFDSTSMVTDVKSLSEKYPVHYTTSDTLLRQCVIGPLSWLWVRMITKHCMCVCVFVDGLQAPTLTCRAACNPWLCVPSVKGAWGLRPKTSSDLFLQWTLLRLCAHRRQWTAWTVSYHICKPHEQTCSSWQRYTLSPLPTTVWPQKPVPLQLKYVICNVLLSVMTAIWGY